MKTILRRTLLAVALVSGLMAVPVAYTPALAGETMRINHSRQDHVRHDRGRWDRHDRWDRYDRRDRYHRHYYYGPRYRSSSVVVWAVPPVSSYYSSSRTVIVNQPVPLQAPLPAVPASDPYYAPDGTLCREYQSHSSINGVIQQYYGTACLQPDGTWRVVR
ncbi:MAG: hypothetical protein M3O22_01450 [Pseudomonadota bacterium]|nr:hypothetical protein [Pseudomonadota bacterium]